MKLIYTGDSPTATLALPTGDVPVKSGEPIEIDDKFADGLLTQDKIWKKAESEVTPAKKQKIQDA